MIVAKNKRAIERMRTAGHLLATALETIVEKELKVGASTAHIDSCIEKEMRRVGLKPECIGYAGYRHATLISINDVVVHGVPSSSILVGEGDLVSIDLVGSYEGYCVDMARTYVMGKNDPASALAKTAYEALDKGLSVLRAGVRLGDMSSVIQQVVESAGYGVIRDFVGHGIGKRLHEDPQVPNFGKAGEGPRLPAGVTLAVEPMITQGSYEVFVDKKDGWSVRTKDGSLSAHVEDTIVVLDDGVEILTRVG